MREIPLYQCHKKVRALKIAGLSEKSGEIYMVPEDEGFAAIPLSSDYVAKHNPQAGGYYVVYEDGYLSYSPEKAFEEGYTRI